ncbi:MAG TPA: potassium channel family protein [Poseidonia sp.]|nr:potassium channel family protein [Poseidonia sp.]
MAESTEEYSQHYTTMKQPWWANDMLILVMTLLNIGIIVYDLENDLYNTDRQLWWILAVIDLVLIGFFVMDLVEDHSRCIDKKWWYKTHGWEFLGLFPMILAGLSILRIGQILRFLRLFRAFSGILRLIGATSRAKKVTVSQQVTHLLLIVTTLIVTGGFLVYVFESSYYNDNCVGNTSAGAECANMIHNIWDSIWWALVTTTTVGYGDFTPVTVFGRIIAAALMFIGIGLVGSLAATFSQLFYSTRSGMDLENDDARIDPISLLHHLSEKMSDGLIEKEDWHTSLLLIRKRMRFELKLLTIELNDTTVLPVPIQVAAKMEMDSSIKKIEADLRRVNSIIEEE